MVSRRYAAAFLVLTAAFLATAILLSNSQFAFAVGMAADAMCKPEVKDKKEYNPSKPWAAYFKEVRNGKEVQIFNLFGVDCYDITVEKTDGHCLRENRCLTDTTAGKKPDQEQPGEYCSTHPKECSGNAGEYATPPEMPQPNSGATEPKPNEPPPSLSDCAPACPTQTEVTPQPNGAADNQWLQKPESGAEATNNSESLTPSPPKTNSFGDFLSGQAPPWLADSANPAPNPFGPDAQGIGPYYGAQTLEPTSPSGSTGSESLFGNSNPSLLEQAVQSDSPGFTNPSGESTSADQPWYAWLYDSTVNAVQSAGSAIQTAYNTAADAITDGYQYLAEATGFSTPTSEVATDSVTDTPTVSDIQADGAPVADNGGGQMQPEVDQISPENQAAQDAISADRENQTDIETARYEQDLAKQAQAIANAQDNIPVPEQVQTDPQKTIEETIAKEAAAQENPSLWERIKSGVSDFLNPTGDVRPVLTPDFSKMTGEGTSDFSQPVKLTDAQAQAAENMIDSTVQRDIAETAARDADNSLTQRNGEMIQRDIELANAKDTLTAARATGDQATVNAAVENYNRAAEGFNDAVAKYNDAAKLNSEAQSELASAQTNFKDAREGLGKYDYKDGITIEADNKAQADQIRAAYDRGQQQLTQFQDAINKTNADLANGRISTLDAESKILAYQQRINEINAGAEAIRNGDYSRVNEITQTQNGADPFRANDARELSTQLKPDWTEVSKAWNNGNYLDAAANAVTNVSKAVGSSVTGSYATALGVSENPYDAAFCSVCSQADQIQAVGETALNAAIVKDVVVAAGRGVVSISESAGSWLGRDALWAETGLGVPTANAPAFYERMVATEWAAAGEGAGARFAAESEVGFGRAGAAIEGGAAREGAVMADAAAGERAIVTATQEQKVAAITDYANQKAQYQTAIDRAVADTAPGGRTAIPAPSTELLAAERNLERVGVENLGGNNYRIAATGEELSYGRGAVTAEGGGTLQVKTAEELAAYRAAGEAKAGSAAQQEAYETGARAVVQQAESQTIAKGVSDSVRAGITDARLAAQDLAGGIKDTLVNSVSSVKNAANTAFQVARVALPGLGAETAVARPLTSISQTVGATESAVARFSPSSWVTSDIASAGRAVTDTAATQLGESASARALSSNPFVNATPVAAIATQMLGTNAVAAPSSVTQTPEGTVAIAADGSESFTPAAQVADATAAPAPTGSTVADAAAPSTAAPSTAAPTPSATTPAPSDVGSAPATPAAPAPSPGSVATAPSAPATSPSGQQAVQTAPEQKQTNSWSQWFSSLPNQVGNPFVSSSQAAPFVNSVADRINVASQETGNRQTSRAYSSDVATNMAEGVRLVCQATGCDATTYAQALGGSCAQESGGCDPTYIHGSSQYQGLGQLSRESASNANRALARVRESPNLTTAERADIDGVIQRTNAWLAGKSAVDPRFAPKDGSYLFAARHTYMPEMGTTPLANIQRAAPGDAATQARLIQLTQLAPSIHNTGQINNWDAPLTASQRSALSNNKLSGATTVREAIAKMNATNYAGKLDSGVAWMNRELANQTGFPSSPVVVSPKNTITSPTTPTNGKTLSPRTDATQTSNPVVKVLDAISKTIGTAVKNNKSPNDRALDMVATLESGNPNMLATDVAARLENAGLKDTEAFTAQRELSAREIENVPTATAGGIAKADASIAKTVANIKANQGIADTLASKGLIPKGSTATANANGSYNVVAPNGASYTLAQTAPSTAKPVVLNPNTTYSMTQLRGMNAPELNRFMKATERLANDRFVTGKVIAANIDVINAFFSQFNRVPEINGLGRSAAVNRVVGGDSNSDHLTGNATDWKTVGVPAKQTQALNKILADRGFDLVTHSHGQGPHTHASMNRAALPNEIPNLSITQNIPAQFALTNSAGKQVGPTVAMTTGNNISNIALKPAPVETWVSTDLKTMMETSLAYNANNAPEWPTPVVPVPQLTITATTPLDAVPVPSVVRGTDLAEATPAAKPSPLPANPVPKVTVGPEISQPNPVPPVTNGGPLADVALPNDPELTPETTLVGTLPPTPTPTPAPSTPAPETVTANPTTAPQAKPVDTVAIQKKIDDTRASITKTKSDLTSQKNQLSTVNGKIADIQKQTQALSDAKTNAASAEKGLRVLEGLWGQPNPAERATLTNGTAAASRLAHNAQQLGNGALANQIRGYVNLLHSMSKPANQTLSNRNAAISQGNSLIASARTLINTSAAKIAGLGNLSQLQATQKSLNDQVAFSNTTLAQLQADEKVALEELHDATSNTVATVPAPETTPQPAPSTPAPETVTVTETTPAPETFVVATPPTGTLTLPPNYSPDVTTVTPGKTYTYAQPINMKGMIFAALGMRTYLPASMLAKLDAATLETQDITFTKAEMDAVQWGKMDKNSYAMLQLILNPDLTLKTGYVAPVPNGEITPGKQILTDIADNVGGAKFTGSPTVVAPSDTLTSADTAVAPRPTVSKSDIPPSAPMRTSEETAQLIKDYGLTRMNPAVAQAMLPPVPAPIARLKPGSHPMMSADMKNMTNEQLESWIKNVAELLQDQAALVFGSHGAPYRRAVVEIVNGEGSSFDRKDGKIRIDMSQIRDSRYENVKASRAAYVVGHEIAHYIAEVTGVDMRALLNLWNKNIVPPITDATAYDNEAIAELQADYIAGVLLRESGLMQADDVKDIYYGIAASGDDFILSKYSDVEVPRSFSGHATGALRAQMFHDGIRVGTVESGLEFYGYESPPNWNLSTPVAWDAPSLPDSVTTVSPTDIPKTPPQMLPEPHYHPPTTPLNPTNPNPTFPSPDLDWFIDDLNKGYTDLNGPGIGTNPVPDMPGLPVQPGRITTQTKTKTDEIETVTNPPEYPVAQPPSGGTGSTPSPLPVQPPPLPTQFTNAQSSWMKILGTTGGIIAAGYIVSLPSGDSSQPGFGTSPTSVAPKDTPTKPPATPGPGVPSTEGILFPKTTGPGVFPPVPKPDAPKPDAPSPKPDTPKVVPKPDTPKPPTPRTGPVPQPKPNPQPGSVPTGQSTPTSGSGAKSGGAMNSIMSFLSGLMKGMAGMFGPQPIQPSTPTGAVSVQIYAVPNPVASSSNSVITWTSVNAASCVLMNASSTPVASGMTNSSFTVSTITATTIYSISCSNQTGSSATGSVIILVQ